METRFFWRNRVTKLRCQRQKPALLRCFAIRRGLCRCSAIQRQEPVLHCIWWCLVNLCLTHVTAAGNSRVSAGYYEFYYICLQWYFRTNEHIANAVKTLVTYWIISYYMGLILFFNMLTPIKKQGDEHIYILLQISVINWISVRYVDILRFVWMLIGSENRDFTLTRLCVDPVWEQKKSLRTKKKFENKKTERLNFSRSVSCGWWESNSHRPTPTTPSK